MIAELARLKNKAYRPSAAVIQEFETLQSENAKLKAAIHNHGDIVLAEWEKLKAENLRLRSGGWLPIGSIVDEFGDNSQIDALFYNGINDCFLGYAKIKKEAQTISYYAYNNGDYNDGGYGNDYRCGVDGYYKFPTHWQPILPPNMKE
jgi:hypothetical protein